MNLSFVKFGLCKYKLSTMIPKRKLHDEDRIWTDEYIEETESDETEDDDEQQQS